MLRLSLIALLISTPALALTDEQRAAAKLDAFLGVAEWKCDYKVPATAARSLQQIMFKDGGREIAGTRIKEQDKAQETYRKDPAAYCASAVALYGPAGSLKRGWLIPK